MRCLSTILLLCFALLSTAWPQHCTVDSLLVNSCGPWLGADASQYSGIPPHLKDQLLAHEQRVGRPMSIAHTYSQPGQYTLTDDMRFFIQRKNTYLLLNWKVALKFADAAGGNEGVNKGIDQFAEEVKSVAPAKIMLSIFHEPEDDVSANDPGLNCMLSKKGVSGTEAEYRAMWRNVRTRFDKAGVKNVVWVMIYMSYEGYHPCMTKALWPGNELVDWVAVDSYGSSKSYEESISRMYRELEQTSDAAHNFKGKNWMLAEFGIHGTRSQAEAYTYYDDMKHSLDENRFPRFKAYVVFDSTGPLFNQIGYGGPGPRSDPEKYFADPEEQKRYNLFANDPKLQ